MVPVLTSVPVGAVGDENPPASAATAIAWPIATLTTFRT